MKTNFLNDLNDAQQEAVINSEGPSLIIAGAGSGKTRVLTYRIAYMLTQGISPWNILALTFTNKAAKEMKERISALVGDENARRLWMGTFHSVFARILRTESTYTGYPHSYSIYDSPDSKNVVRLIIKELGLDEQTYKVNAVCSRISSAKNSLITAGMYAANSSLIKEDASARRPHMAEIYRIYAERCRKAGAMDFDDILLNTNILFRDWPDVLDKYQHFFRYILVDEYQDTNSAQYLIVKKLAAQHGNICVVGDDAQSIYSFRGAKIENILNFRNDYPGYRIFRLEQNYRSTQNIVNAANTLIEKNSGRIPKEVFSRNEHGDRIRVFGTATDQEEGYVVASSILEMQYNSHYANRDFAILYRTNAQSRIFEEALRRRNIPYRVYGGQSFYERKEVKDVLAYGRLLVNPKDDEAFRRIVNFPARSIGDTTVGRLQAAANKAGISLTETAIRADQLAPDIGAAARGKLQRFILFMEEYAKKQDTVDAYELLKDVVTATGIISELQDDKTPENITRLQNIDELLNGIHEFVADNGDDGSVVTLDRYLANVSLLTNADNDKPEDSDRVTVMTVHASKGLEFDAVYVVGLEENLFPSPMAMMSAQEVEEERRLFYVALTRARKHVFLSYAGVRYRFGSLSASGPSRFIREIDPQYLDTGAGRASVPAENFAAPAQRKPVFQSQQGYFSPDGSRYPPSEHTPAAPSGASPSGTPAGTSRRIKPGMLVEHVLFGTGKVIAIDAGGDSARATVHFDKSGTKTLLLKFAKLRIVE